MTALSIWQTLLLTAASAIAAVVLAAAGFVILGQQQIDMNQGMAIAAVITLILGPPVLFPLVNQKRQLTEMAAKLRKLADEDGLTGLANRRAFLSHVREHLERGHAGGTDYAILMLDLDHFKSVNDRFGHAAGDCVLQAVARKTRQITELVAPTSSVIGRLGGEEFAIYLGAAEAVNAPVLAEVLCQVIREWSICHDRNIIRLTASIGVAGVPGSTSVETALGLADAAAYTAKSAGRDRWIKARTDKTTEGIAAA